ncbi:DUF1214 domain-containing protein [bacterium]|nr:DUF1214 domain-containing protein [bacterium]
MTEDPWARFSRRLGALAARIAADDFPADARGRAEGHRHLARLTAFALQWFVDFGDPHHPAFLRFDDDVLKWGGPNADNTYLRARVDPGESYRVWANVRGVRALIVSTAEGDLQMGATRVFAERSLEALTVDADGYLEIALSPTPRPGNWIPLVPGVEHVLIRQYVSDWEADVSVPFHIERVGHEGEAPPALSPEAIAAALERAATWVERTVVHWNAYLAARLRELEPNVMGAPRRVPGGAADILYGAGAWHLADDEALVIRCTPPRARYWSIQLYSPHWFESLDIANRSNSFTGHTAHVDEDGDVRFVLAAHDPGSPNWLDTEGRPFGLVSYRWVWTETAPVPVAARLPLAAVATHLPAAHPRLDARARVEQIRRRRAALTRRFRR